MVKEAETRKCVFSGKILPKEQLLRFVLLKDGTIIPDFNKKIDGHGFYLQNSKKLLQELSAKTNPLNKILHTKTIMNENLPQIVEQILYKKGMDSLNLARKAGDLIMGFEKVRDTIIKGKVSFVIEAADAGEDGKTKIAAMSQDLEKFTLYNVASLSDALKRENTVYLAVKQGPTSAMVYSAFLRYQTFLNE